MTVGSVQRFTRQHPCPICGGYDQAARGKGERCFGFLSDDGEYAHCSREEHAGGLSMGTGSSTYAHRLAGPCRCGRAHGSCPVPARRDPRPPAPPARIVATYGYRDAGGTLRHQTVRYDPKAFKQRRPDGKGDWVWNLAGVDRVLYRLPELLAAPDRAVFIVEGEKDADALARLGLLATTCAEGAGKWQRNADAYAAALAGRHVVILPDNDEPGRMHAQGVAVSLAGTAASVRIVALPDLPEKGDVSDWLAAGGTREALERLVRAAPAWTPASATRPGTISAAALQRLVIPEARWAVRGLLPEGLSLLAGRPKCGKSWLAYAVAIAIAAGGMVLGQIAVEPADVLYLALEDNRRRLQARLNQILDGAPAPERLTLATDWPRLDRGGLAQLGEWLDAHPAAGLVAVDTLARFRPPKQGGQTVYDADYAALADLQKLTLARGVPALVVHHDRKADAEDPFDTVSGSLGLTGAADSLLILRRDAQTPTGRLFLRGRDVEDTELALGWDATRGTWHLLEHGEAGALRLVALLDKLGGSVTRSEALRLLHCSAVNLDAALDAAAGRVRAVARPRADGQPGKPAQQLELVTSRGDAVSEDSELRTISSGADRPNFAVVGAKFTAPAAAFPPGGGADFAMFANGIAGAPAAPADGEEAQTWTA